jgi:hypothetical protein
MSSYHVVATLRKLRQRSAPRERRRKLFADAAVRYVHERSAEAGRYLFRLDGNE